MTSPGKVEVDDDPFTIVEVIEDEEAAEFELERLSTHETNKKYHYSLQSARWYPQGRPVEQ